MADRPTIGTNVSGQLAALQQDLARRDDPVEIGEIIDRLGRSGIGITLLLLALPALVPIPGPFGLVFGSAVAVVGLQLGFGAKRLLIPAFIRDRRLPVAPVRDALAKAIPPLIWIERRLKPRRLLFLTGRAGRVALALPLVTMGVAIALPVPLGNIPPVISLVALSLGLAMRDGVAVLIGLLLAVAALLWFGFLFLFGFEALDRLWTSFA